MILQFNDNELGLISKAIYFVLAAAAGFGAGQYKLVILSNKIKSLEKEKVNNSTCKAIQEKNSIVFLQEKEGIARLEKLIKESNELHQRQHESLVNILLKGKKD